MLQIKTPPGEGSNKNDPKRETQIIIPRTDHGIDVVRGTTSRPYRYEGKVKVEFRADDGALVVFINVNSMMNDGQYRAIVRSLVGWSFAGLVHRRVRSHRRWGKGEDNPYLKASKVEALTDRIVLKCARLLQQHAAVSSPTGQLAGVTT